MEKLTTTLLTGAAMTALAVAPAMAGQHSFKPVGHYRGIAVKTAQGIKILDSLHQKTNVAGMHQPGKTNFYTTYTFTTHDGFCYHTVATCSGNRTWDYSGAFSTWYKQPKDLAGAVVWESEQCVSVTSRFISCTLHDAAGLKAKASVKPAHGKLKAYSTAEHNSTTFTFSTGFREKFNTNLTFYGPAYSLKSKTAASDSGQFDVSDKLDYVYYTTTTGKKHKRKKHTEQFNGTIHTNLSLSFE